MVLPFESDITSTLPTRSMGAVLLLRRSSYSRKLVSIFCECTKTVVGERRKKSRSAADRALLVMAMGVALFFVALLLNNDR